MQYSKIVMSFGVLSAFFCSTEQYQGGAPTEVCESMEPGHGETPKPLPSPYLYTVNKKEIKAGGKITVTVAGNNAADTFKGFLIQARDATNQPIGKFEKVPNAKLISCGSGKDNAITHDSSSEKKSIRVTWVAPRQFKAPIHFYLTTAKNGGEYWVKQKSTPVALSRR